MKNVLIPMNLSHDMHNTLRYAISLCVKNGSNLILYVSNDDRDLNIEESALKFVASIYSDLGLSFDTSTCMIVVENAFYDNDKIKEAVEKYKIELLIVGSSFDAYNTTFFGTSISDLIAELPCSVLTIPQAYSNLVLDRIGYATELVDFHQKIKEIVTFARCFGASIEACHVYPVFPQEVNVAKYDIKHALQQVRAENNYERIDLHFIKTSFNNEPVRGIREFIRLYKPDLLVMCHKPRGIFDLLTLDSSATEAVVKISPIPVLALNCSNSCKLD